MERHVLVSGGKGKGFRFLITIAAVTTGFAALIYEVIAAKVLFYFFQENTYSTAAVIAIFLSGLALGSFLFGRIHCRIREDAKFFLAVNWSVAAYVLTVLPQFQWIPRLFDEIQRLMGPGFMTMLAAKVVVAFLYLIVPTVLLGMLLPFLLAVTIRTEPDPAGAIARVYGLDLLGAIGGAMLSGFWFLPQFGLKATIILAGMVNMFSGMVFLHGEGYKQIYAGAGVAAGCLILVFIQSLDGKTTLYSLALAAPVSDIFQSATAEISSVSPSPEQEKIIFYKSSPFGEIRVVDRIAVGGGQSEQSDVVRRLLIDGRMQCETIHDASERHFVETALSALAVRGREARVLNIGLGCGLTLHSIMKHRQVSEVDVVEINPVIAEAAEFFDRHTEGALKDPRVQVIIDDGFHFLRQKQNPYDLIAVDVEDPSVMYSSPLYTAEFFMQVQAALKPDGIFTLWAYSSSCEAAHAVIYATLKQVFPYVEAKTSGRYHDVYFFASGEDLSDVLGLTPDDRAYLQRLRNMPVPAFNTMNRPVLMERWNNCFSGDIFS